LLKETLPLERAQMRIKLHLPKKEAKKLKEKIVTQFSCKFENEDWTDDALLLVHAIRSQFVGLC
jgi:ribosome maturation protein SDO1